MFKCTEKKEGVVCGRGFADQRLLKQHKERVHNPKSSVTCRRLVDGKVCGVILKTKQSYDRHVQNLHTPVKCEECPELDPFPDKFSLTKHKESIHVAVFKCRKVGCYKNFTSTEQRASHERVCNPSEDKIICGVQFCFAKFSNEPHYKTHLKVNHELNDDEISKLIDDQTLPQSAVDGPDKEKPTKLIFKKPKLDIPAPATVTKATEFEFQLEHPTSTMMLNYGNITVCYDYSLRGPRWVHQDLPRGYISEKDEKLPRPGYHVETKIPAKFRSGDEDYKDKKFDRGHAAPARNHQGNKENFEASHYHSNIFPQLPDFNRKYWALVERHERNFSRSHNGTQTYTGGLYKEPMGMCGRIPVASHFFKVLIGKNSNVQGLDIEIYIVPHKHIDTSVPLSNFHASLSKLEEMAGLNLFPNLHLLNFRRVNGKVLLQVPSSSH